MQVTAIKTRPVVPGTVLIDILDEAIPHLEENTVIVVTSKIVSICEGNTLPIEKIDKQSLVENEADQYLVHPLSNRFGVTITVKNNILISNAGIDESNGNNHFILWPQNPFDSAQRIWSYLQYKHQLTDIGVLITDSNIIPLRWGTRGIGLAWCGFRPLNSYIGKPDIFNRTLKMTNASVVDGLAAAAVVMMGEGNEQTPLATITEVPSVKFTNHPPTKDEIHSLKISLEDDIYAPLLIHTNWKSNKNK